MPRYPDAFDMDEADERANEPQEVSCNRCGASDLYWQEVFGPTGVPGFRLYADGKPHVCKPNADDFEALA